jgi:DNA-binding SARP family transcriptional activator
MQVATAPVVRLLDGFAVEPAAGGPPVGELPRGVQRLVAHLCLTGRPARTAIAGELWPDVREEHAQGSLRSALWRLQKAVPGLLDVAGGTLAPAVGVRVDVVELVSWARRVLDPRGGVEDLAVPDAGLRGELLPGWYDDWVLLERERIWQRLLHAFEALSRRHVADGRLVEAVEAAMVAVKVDPLRETAQRVLLEALVCQGNWAQARRQYHAYRDLLARELGVEPDPGMARILHREHALTATGAIGPGVLDRRRITA